MRVTIAAVAACILLLSTSPTPQASAAMGVPTWDMAGAYDAPDFQATVVIHPNGTAGIVWDNQYGRLVAEYIAVSRIPGGGFVAESDDSVNPFLPNGARVIAIKPAERGYIQLITFDQNTQAITGVYRMYKFR